jgi:hypothetical protein
MYVTGQRIRYTGDMANRSGWGTVTHARPCQNYGLIYTLEMDDSRIFSLYPHDISDKYYGDFIFRFITKEAYAEYRSKAMEQFHG